MRLGIRALLVSHLVLVSLILSFVHSIFRMITLKPSLLTQSPVSPSSYVQAAKLERRPTSSHAHISFVRSVLLDMQIYSPSVKLVKQHGPVSPQPVPVFSDQDKIEGKVMLDPSCSQSGRLTISLEGFFEYAYVEKNAGDEYLYNPMVQRHRRVFLSSSATVSFAPISDSRSTFREALGVRKKSSTSSLKSAACRSCEFSFELPRGSRAGEEIPSTFSSTTPAGDLREQSCMEELEVAYRITAVWEALDGSGKQAMLEGPVLYQPDFDFQPVGGSVVAPESWIEMPLISERPIPFNCAVTLPRPQSFSRCGSIPYFVVFATNAPSPSLMKEIAADATIAVSLVRKITISPQRTSQLPTLPDTPPASDDSDCPASPFRSRLLKRSVRPPTRFHNKDEFFPSRKPTFEVPQEVFSVSRTLQTEVSIGFPKRPRTNNEPQSLPDGLYKGKVRLSADMLPSVDWPGVSVKYFLDVCVSLGLDAVRARVPIRLY